MEQCTMPSFSAEIGTPVKDSAEAGNAILINKENGIFATCAHVVRRRWNEYKLLVRHSERQGGVKVVERWYHWDADVALVRMDPNKLYALSDYTEATVIGSLQSGRSLPKASVAGFVDTKPFSRKVSFMRFPTNIATTMPNFYERDAVQRMWYIPKAKRAILYESYLLLHIDGIQSGASGSAVVNSDGQLMGIVSRGSDSQVLAIPASEIVQFAKRVL